MDLNLSNQSNWSTDRNRNRDEGINNINASVNANVVVVAHDSPSLINDITAHISSKYLSTQLLSLISTIYLQLIYS